MSAPFLAGGLVGQSEASITGSTASGAVTATRTNRASYAGGLVGQNKSGPIQNSHASGDVTGSQNYVGGLVGDNKDALAESTASGTVTTTGSLAGGLVGVNSGSISDSAAFNPSVTGLHSVGGLVGLNNNTIDRSTATASVTANAEVSFNVGGLVGLNAGPVRDSYAGGAVQGFTQKGGLIGLNNPGAQVIDSRADGAVGNSTTAGTATGGLVGLNKGAVAGSVATGTVSGSAASTALGGLVGQNEGSISGSAATGAVSGGQQVGGLVGSTGGSVTESWASGAVSASPDATISESGTQVGGLIGWNEGTVGASFATGNVTGAGSVGGLIGKSARTVNATYATGDVTGSGDPFCTTGVACPEGVGGLIGGAEAEKGTPVVAASSVEASYSTGTVSGSSTHVLGGLAGNAERDTTTPSDSASFTNSYWDTGTSGQTLGVGSDDEDENGAIDGTETATAGVTGQTTAALKAPTDYTGIFANWNVTITNVTARTGGPWDFGAATDYPVLRGLSASPSFAAGTATRSVAEELAAGASIGSPLTATDSDALSYKLVGADAIFFSINSMTGQLLTKTLLDYENPGDADRDNEYEFMIQARDGTTVDFRPVTVTVTDAIENLAAPIITGDATVTVTENSTAVATYQAVDPDGATTFTWTLGGNDAGAFEISDAGVLTFDPAPDFEAPGDANTNNIYEVTVQADDGGMTGDFDVLVTVEGEPELPEITLASGGSAVTVDGNAVSVDENYDGRLVLVSVTDPDGTHTDYTLTLGGADGSSFTLSGNQVRFSSPPNYEARSQYDLTVTAANAQESETIDVTVTVGDVDEPPEITLASAAGVDVTVDESAVSVQENHTADLVEVTATDPEGTHADYTLALGGTHSGSFTLNAGVLRFTNPPDHEAREVYRLSLTASNASETSTLNVTVTVGDMNEPPVVMRRSGTGAFSIEENSGTTVGSFDADDPENDDVTWSLVPGGDSRFFEIDETSGALSFKESEFNENEIPDYESSDLGSGLVRAYNVTVRATEADDGDPQTSELPGSLAVTINITDVDEPPEITLASAAGVAVTVDESAVSVQENHTADLVDVTATDPEGIHADYTFALGGTHSGSFTLNAGVLRFTNPPDHEAREVYRLSLTASNASETSTLNVTVTVGDVPEPPVISGEAEFTVNEGHTELLRTYQKSDPDRPMQTTNWGPVGSSAVLSGADSTAFRFDLPTGRLTFASPPDFEGGAQYQVILTANDGMLEGTHDITVNVANLEETGTLALSGGVLQGANGVLLQATLTDPDIVATETWVWQRRTGTSGAWTDIANTNASSYTPTAADVGQYLRASVTYTDGAGTEETTLTVATESPTVNDASGNQPPTPPDPLPQVAAIPENVGGGNVARVVFTDPEGERLTYSLDGSSEFVIDTGTGQITVQSGGLDYEDAPIHNNIRSHEVTVKAADPLGASATATLTVEVEDVNEPPTAGDFGVTVLEDETVDIDVVGMASDKDAGDTLTVAGVVSSPGEGGTTVNDVTNNITYTPQANYHGADSFTYQVKDQGGLPSNTATVTITVNAVNDAPEFPSTPVTRTVSENASESDSVGAPVVATDIDGDTPTYSLLGADASSFEIDAGGQITVGAGVTFHIATQETYEVTVEANDGNATARIPVTITVVAGPVVVVRPPTSGGGSFGGGGGGGGGGSSGPSPSTLDFEWTVKHDIEDLDGGHDTPTGLWSDGATLWILENGEGADDAVYAYDLATGERGEEREFALAETNRAPRGFWSNGETVWVSDSGRERLFAYGLASGEREESREVELAERNSDARGIWSDEETMWVLDGGKDSLFAYDLATGDLLAEYSLASRNGDPQGIWSDGVTVWVSDHGAKQLLAYRLPTRPDAPEDEDPVSVPVPLKRVDDEDFTELSSSSNNSPRGIWSDGDYMYVADESDDKVYTYNLPDAIDTRLASLSLSGVDIGEFDPGRTEYEGTVGDGVTETTVTAEALQRRTDVDIDPSDADEEAEGHQVALQGVSEITVTVTSADGSRRRTYRVAFAPPVMELVLSPTWTSFEWPGADGTAVIDALREGGISDRVLVIYEWDEAAQTWLAYFPGLGDVLGLNTLTTLRQGSTYWVAVTEPLTWSVANSGAALAAAARVP